MADRELLPCRADKGELTIRPNPKVFTNVTRPYTRRAPRPGSSGMSTQLRRRRARLIGKGNRIK
jgi:hypothetical protein